MCDLRGNFKGDSESFLFIVLIECICRNEILKEEENMYLLWMKMKVKLVFGEVCVVKVCIREELFLKFFCDIRMYMFRLNKNRYIFDWC